MSAVVGSGKSVRGKLMGERKGEITEDDRGRDTEILRASREVACLVHV